MQLHPTRSTFQVAVAGAALVAVGVAVKAAPAIAFGGAMLLAVTLGRSLALTAITRIRVSGFEMVWSSTKRITTAPRDSEVVLEAELRNRGADEVRGVNLRAVASSMLDVTIDPPIIDLPASSTVRFEMHVRGKRVGRWGVHGLALEVRGTPLCGDGLYEVPLLFANPHGIEVMPRPLSTMLQTARGGRARRGTEEGRSAPLAGDGDQLRELRERAPGDAFKHIAWKASARRGLLLVREMEREERDVVWLVLDTSVELWAGEPGKAPLDIAVNELAAVAARHLARGDRVGFVMFASHAGTRLAPATGPLQATRIVRALASAASMTDADRCELSELEIASRVLEHLRPLDPRSLSDLLRKDLDALSARAEMMRSRAPFAPRLPSAQSPREQRLRHYLAAFGIEVPPRADGERHKASAFLAELLERIVRDKKARPSIVHVWAPPPNAENHVDRTLRKLRGAHVEVRWSMPVFDPSLEARTTGGSATVDGVVHDAVRIRVRAAQTRAERMLRGSGVRLRP
ncbi:MAG: DUF58 domain-containing protein [Polyangiaceae bacterium]|nr:DUF58 domain-containing protein [Polyangiaceae bacterium]